MNDKRHTLREYDAVLNRLKIKVLKMASLSEFSLKLVSKALMHRDEDAANQAIAEDEQIDELELSVDKDGMNILACFSPMASDLRFVLALIRVSSILERIGDECVSMARRIKKLNKSSELKEVRLLEPLIQALSTHLNRLTYYFEVSAFSQIRRELKEVESSSESIVRLTDKYVRLADMSDTGVPELAELILCTRSLRKIATALQKLGEEVLLIEVSR